MDTNFQPTPDQPESTQPVPVIQRSGHGLLMAVGALLLLSLLANVYFFSKLNQSKMVDQPSGSQIPVVQTGTEPTVNISETPGSEIAVSPDADEMQGWKTLTTNYFKVRHPSDVKSVNWGSMIYSLEKWGPTQQEDAEFYDGISIRFQVKEINDLNAEQYAKNKIEETKKQQIADIVQELKPMTLRLSKGFTYTSSGLGIHRYYIFQVGKIDDAMILEITDSTVDPTNQGYQTTVNKILNTLEIY